MADSYISKNILKLVRFGFYDKKALLVKICDEEYLGENIKPEDVSEVIDEAFERFEIEKKAWPKVTDCDRINKAFDSLNKLGIMSMHNIAWTTSQGYWAYRDRYDKHPNKSSFSGFSYYHGQDILDALEHNILSVAFGSTDEDDEQKGVKIGKIVYRELESAGLNLSWDGTFDMRVVVTKINWQRR